MGYFTSDEYLNISERAYTGTTSPVMTFRIEKAIRTPKVDTGYRYEGKNPNNYVMFNNELWRIIGVFETEYDSNNNGTVDATDNLVKIIRAYSLGGYDWDKTNSNNWPNSSLYHLLNYQYYDWETNKNTASDYCISFAYTSMMVPGQCEFSVTGIQNGYRNMIANAKWYLGGRNSWYYDEYIPSYIYTMERDSNYVYTGNSPSTVAHVGLIYESDYLFASLKSDCEPGNSGLRAKLDFDYGTSTCGGKNWLYGQGILHTMTPVNDNSEEVISILFTGDATSVDAWNCNHTVRPVVYLSKDIYRVSGTGIVTDPYIIGLATSLAI